MDIETFIKQKLGIADMQYQINPDFTKDFYSERLVEHPFLWKHILPAPAKVLDIGCWESIFGIQLAMLGYEVQGIDIQKYGYRHPHFNFIYDSFLKHTFEEQFDIVINLSAIEHFGLSTYTNTEPNANADRLAVEKVQRILKPNGQFLFTAPFGRHAVYKGFERIYDSADIMNLLQDFEIKTKQFFLIEKRNVQQISQKEADSIPHEEDRYAVILVDARR